MNSPQFDLFTTYHTPHGPVSGHIVRPDGTINKRPPTQTEILYKYLKAGGRIADHESFNILGFPNLRSRVCDVEREYGIQVRRVKREGKRYLEYFL